MSTCPAPGDVSENVMQHLIVEDLVQAPVQERDPVFDLLRGHVGNVPHSHGQRRLDPPPAVDGWAQFLGAGHVVVMASNYNAPRQRPLRAPSLPAAKPWVAAPPLRTSPNSGG